MQNLRKFIRETIEKLLNESAESIEIEITPHDQDERYSKKQIKSYDVNYQVTVNGNLIEITGTLKPYNSGRGEFFKFEPDYFVDADSENYFDENWEEIESQIINKLYELGI